MKKDFPVEEFGAAADGATNDAAALQRAVDAAAAAGGGRVVLPAGRVTLAGSFHLASQVELHIPAGATLRSSSQEKDFPNLVFESGDEAGKRYWIGARDATGIALTGHGVVDGCCHAFALGELPEIFHPTVPWRPAMTCFVRCRHLTVRDLTFQNSANWTLHLVGCEDVLIEDICIRNDLKFPNADGIDPDHSRRVQIRRCDIASADDAIVLKNTAPFSELGACEDIIVEDCRLRSASSALKIGSESHGDFRRIEVRRCRIEDSHRGVAIQMRDGGTAEDLLFENLEIRTRRYPPVFWGAGEPFSLTCIPRQEPGLASRVRNVTLRAIRAAGPNGLVLLARPFGSVSNIYLENIELEIPPASTMLLDPRPCSQQFMLPGAVAVEEPSPWGRIFLIPATALYQQGITDLKLEGCRGWESFRSV